MFSATRQVREQPHLLDHVAHPPPQRRRVHRAHVHPFEQDLPASGSISRLVIFSSVVLPQPDGPKNDHKLAIRDLQADFMYRRAKRALGIGLADVVVNWSFTISRERSRLLDQEPLLWRNSFATSAGSRLLPLTS